MLVVRSNVAAARCKQRRKDEGARPSSHGSRGVEEIEYDLGRAELARGRADQARAKALRCGTARARCGRRPRRSSDRHGRHDRTCRSWMMVTEVESRTGSKRVDSRRPGAAHRAAPIIERPIRGDDAAAVHPSRSRPVRRRSGSSGSAVPGIISTETGATGLQWPISHSPMLAMTGATARNRPPLSQARR